MTTLKQELDELITKLEKHGNSCFCTNEDILSKNTARALKIIKELLEKLEQ